MGPWPCEVAFRAAVAPDNKKINLVAERLLVAGISSIPSFPIPDGARNHQETTGKPGKAWSGGEYILVLLRHISPFVASAPGL